MKRSATAGRDNLQDISVLKQQISLLENEVDRLRKKDSIPGIDRKDMELRHELKLAQKDIEIYQK